MQENFRQFLQNLREAGELIDFKQPVDIRHIATLVDQSDKALMFHNVIGYDMPVVSGIIRSKERAMMSLGAKTYGEIEEKLAKAIANPPGRLDKLGVKPGMRVAILDLDDPDFAVELATRATLASMFSEIDMLIMGADSPEQLDRLPDVIPMLAERGALWIVSLKGRLLRIRDVEVMAAARAHGLVDNKVCAFSDARTALRFTRRR